MHINSISFAMLLYKYKNDNVILSHSGLEWLWTLKLRRGSLCSVALSHDAMGGSTFYNCAISWSYAFFLNCCTFTDPNYHLSICIFFI